jgi:hypothetical protein
MPVSKFNTRGTCCEFHLSGQWPTGRPILLFPWGTVLPVWPLSMLPSSLANDLTYNCQPQSRRGTALMTKKVFNSRATGLVQEIEQRLHHNRSKRIKESLGNV